jgi:hypothetical protein
MSVLPAVVKRSVDDWLAKGYSVEIVLTEPQTIRVTRGHQPPTDLFDLVEMKR